MRMSSPRFYLQHDCMSCHHQSHGRRKPVRQRLNCVTHWIHWPLDWCTMRWHGGLVIDASQSYIDAMPILADAYCSDGHW